MKHTIKPWRFEQDVHATRWLIYEGETLVAITFGGNIVRLIAQAPMMYEALKWIATAYANADDFCLQECARKARQAISKVESE